MQSWSLILNIWIGMITRTSKKWKYFNYQPMMISLLAFCFLLDLCFIHNSLFQDCFYTPAQYNNLLTAKSLNKFFSEFSTVF